MNNLLCLICQWDEGKRKRQSILNMIKYEKEHEGEQIMEDHIKAHHYSSNHRKHLLKDHVCGCFYCLSIFDPSEIKEWVEDQGGTALCPYCDIDSIIGESSGYPITKEFLMKMHNYWF